MIASPTDRHQLDPLDYIETALVGAALASIPAVKLPADLADVAVVIHYAGGPFRFTVHGTVPGPAFGWPAEDGDAEDLSGYEAKKWQACLALGATAGTVRVGIYLRRR